VTLTPIPSSTLTPIPTSTREQTPQPSAEPSATATISPGRIIGYSSQARPIIAYEFGRGPINIVFIGGIHGGYEWNTILLAYRAIDYFQADPAAVPEAATLTIIPAANPDGQFLVTGREGRFAANDVAEDTIAGRFNGNDVDLNRNWACNWEATGLWRDRTVSGGSRPFSEPETRLLRDFLLEQEPALVVFWHSAANGVFASGCPEIFAPSLALARVYGEAAGYPIHERFTSYPITGDAADWLATQDIPAISVELRNHQDLDWTANLAGMLRVLDHYGN
jgi:hypothetical protein